MSESHKQILELIASDPETRPLAPLIKVILELPQEVVPLFLRFLEIWVKLHYIRQAMLLLTLMECEQLTDEQIAKLCSVHRRTLYKDPRFKEFKEKLRRSKRDRLPPEDDATEDDDEECEE